jgi:mevalonate kinase
MVLLKKITTITPGKAILFGEHFVVYGYPSIIFAISKKMEITVHFESSQSKINNKKMKNGIKIKISSNLGFNAQVIDNNIKSSNSCFSLNPDVVTNLNKILQFLVHDNKDHFNEVLEEDLFIHIHSEIPIGGGLGSSSALCVSLTGAIYAILNKKLNKDLLCKKSIELERVINPNTSGVDCNICTFGGFGKYDKLSGFKRLECNTSDLQFLIINSGINHNTFEMVNKVKIIKENDIDLFKKLCGEYQKILEFSLELLKKKDLEGLGVLMDENHFLLKNLSLSNPVVDKVVAICKHYGAYGTKITGAGGGGCILSLINMDEKYLLNRLVKDLDELKLCYYFVNSDDYGFRITEKDFY